MISSTFLKTTFLSLLISSTLQTSNCMDTQKISPFEGITPEQWDKAKRNLELLDFGLQFVGLLAEQRKDEDFVRGTLFLRLGIAIDKAALNYHRSKQEKTPSKE